MPQTITARVHATITAAANDLVTVNFAGDTENQVLILNNGPGIVWISFDPTVAAAVGNANCFAIKTGTSFTRTHVVRNTSFTLNSDTAATQVCVSLSPYP
jgi:predicted NAD/FAD-dependent oxidoreductase